MPRKNSKNGSDGDTRFCEKHATSLHESIAESRVRIDELKEDILALRPSRGDKWIMWTLVFMMLTTLVGGVWFFGEKLMERPTSTEVEKVYTPLKDKLEEVRKESSEHHIILNDMKDDLNEIKDDLKELKRR